MSALHAALGFLEDLQVPPNKFLLQNAANRQAIDALQFKAASCLVLVL
jgi:hypothetical protein